MKIKVTEAIRKQLGKEGLLHHIVDDSVEVAEDAFRTFRRTIASGHDHLNDAEKHALAVFCCLTHPNHRKDAPPPVVSTGSGQAWHPEPVQQVSVADETLQNLRAIKRAAWVGVLLLFVLLFSSVAHCQYDPTAWHGAMLFQDNTGTQVGASSGPFFFRVGANGTWTFSGGAWILNFSGGTASAGGSNTQLQYNNAGSLGGISTLTTNGTVVTQQVGSNFLLVDPIDTTKKFQFDGSNIATATTRTVNVPNANSTTVQADTGAANNFLTAISAQGVISKARPACGSLSDSGTACTAVAPANTAAVAHNFVTAYTAATGAFPQAQPACSDLSNGGTLCSSSAALPATKAAVSGQPLLSYDSTSGGFTQGALTATNVGLGNVTNDAQTKAAIFPNTAPGAGQVGVGNAGGTAYAPVSVSADGTLAPTGALTIVGVNGVAYSASPATDTTPVITAANTATYKAIPNCTDTGGNHINYTTSTHAFSCGTSSSGGGSGTFIDWQGPAGPTTGTAADVTIYTTTLSSGIPAGKCIRVSWWAVFSTATATTKTMKIKLGANLTFSGNSSNTSNNSNIGKTQTVICNNSGVQNAQSVVGDPWNIGSGVIFPGAGTGTTDTSVSVTLTGVFNAPNTEAISSKGWLVEWIQ